MQAMGEDMSTKALRGCRRIAVTRMYVNARLVDDHRAKGDVRCP